MTGQLEKLQKGDFSGVIEGIDGAIKALNETIKATGPVLADLVKEFEGAFTDIKGVTKGFLEWWPKFRDWPKKSREEQWKDIQDWFNDQDRQPAHRVCGTASFRVGTIRASQTNRRLVRKDAFQF